MGLSPAQIDAMSLWQFTAAWSGWKRANTVTDGPRFPTDAEHEAAIAFAQTIH